MNALRTSIFLLLVLLLWGCGGNSGGEGTPALRNGTGVLRIHWPEADSRFLPLAAKAVRLDLTMPGQTIPSVVVARPATGSTTTTELRDLPFGQLRIAAHAVPEVGGGGTPQASGTTTVEVTPHEPFQVGLALASTIVNIEATLEGRDTLTIEQHEIVSLTLTARDSQGRVVLVRNGDLRATSLDTSIVTIDDLEVTALRPGTVTLELREIDSGFRDEVDLTVTNNPDGTFQTVLTNSGTVTIDGVALANSPNLNPSRWAAFTGTAPNRSGQTTTSATLRLQTSSGFVDGVVVTEPSGLMRNVLRAEVLPGQLSDVRTLRTLYRYAATLQRRELQDGRPDVLPTPPTATERAAYLGATSYIDFNSTQFHNWLSNNSLTRLETETSVAFARRVCAAVASTLASSTTGSSSASGTLANGGGDSAALSAVIVAALRANDIPARALSGGFVRSTGVGNPFDPTLAGSFQAHVTAEMWHPTAGWVRVDGNRADEVGADAAGWDDGNFVAFSIGEGWSFATSTGTTGTSNLLLTPQYLLTGTGNLNGFNVSHTWTVVRN
jgi:transglutaminase-like putative cysteine protease